MVTAAEIIPAAGLPEYRALRADETAQGGYTVEPVIAWRVSGDRLAPVTPWGALSDELAVQGPDQSVYAVEGRFKNAAEWLASKRTKKR